MRRPQLSLRSLFLVVTLSGVFTAAGMRAVAEYNSWKQPQPTKRFSLPACLPNREFYELEEQRHLREKKAFFQEQLAAMKAAQEGRKRVPDYGELNLNPPLRSPTTSENQNSD